MPFLFRESYVMAPFPEVMLRVRCGLVPVTTTLPLSFTPWTALSKQMRNGRSLAVPLDVGG